MNVPLLTAALLACMTNSLFSADKSDDHLPEVRKLLREVPLIDGHNDVPWQYRKRQAGFDDVDLSGDTRKLRPPMVTDIARLRAGGVGGQFWSVYIPTSHRLTWCIA
jgi:membrane dipeptidase